MLRLRDSGGSLDYGKFDEFKKRWAKIDEPMTEELKRLSRMNGVGPDYDKQLGEFNRVLFYNPFR